MSRTLIDRNRIERAWQGRISGCQLGKPVEVLSMARGRAKLSEYLRISEAAEYLGVSPNTLRNWERVGKTEAQRHPVNSYRLFKKEELDALLKQVQNPDAANAKTSGKPR